MVRLSIWPINDETIREPDMDISDPKHIIFLCLPYYISTSFVSTVNRQQLGIRSLSGRATITSLVLVRLADTAFFFCKLFLLGNILISLIHGGLHYKGIACITSSGLELPRQRISLFAYLIYSPEYIGSSLSRTP